ncbi:hypothetical protein SAMN02910453_0350 [Lachnospiraceae bacterium A10]|nr:hypothetical protein SAMN02910453_0350 [Lachnospiraceae bacterium A10]
MRFAIEFIDNNGGEDSIEEMIPFDLIDKLKERDVRECKIKLKIRAFYDEDETFVRYFYEKEFGNVFEIKEQDIIDCYIRADEFINSEEGDIMYEQMLFSTKKPSMMKDIFDYTSGNRTSK